MTRDERPEDEANAASQDDDESPEEFAADVEDDPSRGDPPDEDLDDVRGG